MNIKRLKTITERKGNFSLKKKSTLKGDPLKINFFFLDVK